LLEWWGFQSHSSTQVSSSQDGIDDLAEIACRSRKAAQIEQEKQIHLFENSKVK